MRLASILICGPPSLVNVPLALTILKKCASSELSTTDNSANIQKLKGNSKEGNADAQNMLGELTEMGLHGGIEGKPDYEKAVTWYRLAVQQGHGRAMFNLGAMYERGLFVERDMDTAVKFYREVWEFNLVCKARKPGFNSKTRRFT